MVFALTARRSEGSSDVVRIVDDDLFDEKYVCAGEHDIILFPFFICVQQSLKIHLKATTTIVILPLSINATNNGNNNDNLGLDDPTIKPEKLHETTRTKAP